MILLNLSEVLCGNPRTWVFTGSILAVITEIWNELTQIEALH